MINTFNEIKNMLVFESEDDFYYLQILQRKKENPSIGSNSKVIRSYLINNIEYLEEKMPRIIELCNLYNARAMLRLNKRSYKKVAFKTMINVANSISNQEYKFVEKSYSRAIGKGHNDKNKKWIIDIDGDTTSKEGCAYVHRMSMFIESVEPQEDRIYKTLSTKNGLHLITKPFNLQKFKAVYPYVDVHKDNPINLYIP